MKYLREPVTGQVYAYPMGDLATVASLATLEHTLAAAQAHLRNLPEPAGGGEADRIEYAEAEQAVAEAQTALDAVPQVFFEIRERLKSLVEMTPEEVEAHLNPPVVPLTLEQIQALRRAAYVAESDPLKIEAEHDSLVNGTAPDYTAWLAAVEAIKARYPLPSPEVA